MAGPADAGSGMVVETGGGFRFGQLSPRRQRERKRARFGCGLADDVLDSPSPSPNPTPLASPFERDEQVVVREAARAVPRTRPVPRRCGRARAYARGCSGSRRLIPCAERGRLPGAKLTAPRMRCSSAAGGRVQCRPVCRRVQPKVHAARRKSGRCA